MPKQTAIVELAGKTFAVVFNFTLGDTTTGLGESIDPEHVFWEKDGIRDGEDWYEFFEKMDIWKKLEEAIWKQIEGERA